MHYAKDIILDSLPAFFPCLLQSPPSLKKDSLNLGSQLGESWGRRPVFLISPQSKDLFYFGFAFPYTLTEQREYPGKITANRISVPVHASSRLLTLQGKSSSCSQGSIIHGYNGDYTTIREFFIPLHRNTAH